MSTDLRTNSTSSPKPVVTLLPTDLWHWRKDRLEWLREARDSLVSRCRTIARKVVAHRVPSPEEEAAGAMDTWDLMAARERQRLYASVFEQLVEASGAGPVFVEKLLPQPVEQVVLEAVQQRRDFLAETTMEATVDLSALRARVQRETRRVLRAFIKKVPLAQWQPLPPEKKEERLARLTGLVADRLGLSLQEIVDALDASMDAILHQEALALRSAADKNKARISGQGGVRDS